ncbi:MAG TPA: hypothetical protein DCX80_08595, partial [Chloroflexi bacterium]|nr:hypothetical protein [Chloroflexota bacterium]
GTRKFVLDISNIGSYHGSTMEQTISDHSNSLVEQQPSYWWFYFYFTPPASLVGYSGLSR